LASRAEPSDRGHVRSSARAGGGGPEAPDPIAQAIGPTTAPLVSVITVCRNAAATLETCLASVAGQTYPRVEYIIIDGGSTDGSAAVLERHRAAIAVLVSEPDGGIYDAMNKGLARATGDFVIFLNADDAFVAPGVIADAVAAMALQPDGDVYYGSILIRMPAATTRHDPPPPDEAAEEMIIGCLPHQATFARRAVFERTGRFDLRWRRHADYDWWLKVIADDGLRVRRIPTLVASFALGGASSDLLKGQPEVFAIQNAAALYRSAAWDRRRIEAYQRAWLAARAELAARDAGRGPSILRHRSGQLRSWLVRSLPAPMVKVLRAAKRRLLG